MMPSDVATAQLISSAALTAMSLTVGIVAAIFTYRNNFGWKPIGLVTGIGLSGIGGNTKNFNAHVKFEIWNRRKYPIVVRYINAEFECLDLDRSDKADPNAKWHMYRNSMILHEEQTIAPQSHEKHEVLAPFTTSSLDALRAPVKITILYFDPRSTKTSEIKLSRIYTFKNIHENRQPWYNKLYAKWEGDHTR